MYKNVTEMGEPVTVWVFRKFRSKIP